jgi:hypothetical protein
LKNQCLVEKLQERLQRKLSTIKVCKIWGSHSSGYEELYLLRCFHLQGQGINRARSQHESSWNCLSPTFTLVSCYGYSSALTMQAMSYSQTSVDYTVLCHKR